VSRLRPIQQYASVAAIVLWLGGFTFYASIVVPIGEQVVGGLPQGYVTQRVTDRINVIGLVMILMIAADIWGHRKHMAKPILWARLVSATVFAVGLVMLVFLHDQMDLLLDMETKSRPDRSVFKPMHQRYQMTMTFMWLATVFELGAMMHGHRRRAVWESSGDSAA
jgi:arginine exporter protein ArgO